MFRILSFVLVLWVVFGSAKATFHRPDVAADLSDSSQIEIKAIYDGLGLIDQYRVTVKTPVCEAEKCYAIQLEFYYDPIGKFLSYDTLQGQELTKLDHIPFVEADYLKLQHILNNRHSLLASYTKDELVNNTRISEIDGVTGATSLEIRESVIEGAVYSCYTLWHIAHGPLIDSLQTLTASMFNQNLVKKLVDKNDQEVNYYLINSYSEQDFHDYLPEVLRTISNGQGYYAKNALEKIPIEVLNSPLSQQFFGSNFDQLDYFAQVVLLNKLQKESLSASLKNTLMEAMDQRNSLRNELIVKLTESP